MTIAFWLPADSIEPARLIADFANWLLEYPWSHWITLTSRDRLPPERLKRVFFDGYVRNLTRVSQGPVKFFFVIEGGAQGDNPHIHALLFVEKQVDLQKIGRTWRWGRAQVAKFDARRGAAQYMLKDINGRVIDWNFDLPAHRCRRQADLCVRPASISFQQSLP